MKESDYYPNGAYNDSSAPYNEPYVPERDFAIDVEYTLCKQVDVTTNDYQPEFEEETGQTYANTENTDWEDAYGESGHYTILEMLAELKKYVEQDISTTGEHNPKGRALKLLLEDCQGWTMLEKCYTEQ